MMLAPEDISRIIEMAWEDRTSFEAIKIQYGYSEADVIALMRREMKKVVSRCGESVYTAE